MSDEPKETLYYLRFMSMYMDLATEIVLDVFVYHSPGKDAETFLKSKESEIIKLKKKVLNRQQCSLLFQKGNDVLKSPLDIKSFDISLLITLSRNLFTSHELAPPVEKWYNPPKNSDKSIAADLLRLNIIRNVIVAHFPRARLPDWRFKKEWKNVSNILIRLQQQVAPEYEDHLKGKIDAYRWQRLETTAENKYDEKLKEWHIEVSKMQNQAKELIKKLGEFDAYFNNKNDRFERYTKILFKGGHFVLSAFLGKKIKDEGKELQQMLTDKEDAIRRDISHDLERLEKVYPSNPPSPIDSIDTSSWDVSLLSTVISHIFICTEDKGVIECVREIGEACGNLEKTKLKALDSNLFEDYWTDLKSSMKIVSHKLDEDNVKHYNQILDECKKEIDEKEFETFKEELKTQGVHIKSFKETYKEVIQDTKDLLQEMITSDIKFKNHQVLELKMITVGSNEQKKEIAEEILIVVWKEALDRAVKSEDFLDVKREVSNILKEIKKSESVKNISVKQKCILLQIKSTSPQKLLEIINYFESEQFHETLRNVSIELGYLFDTALNVYSVIPVECLWRINNHKNETVDDEERGIILPVTVSSPAGMKQLISLWSKDKIANSTKVIANALSKHLDAHISLKADAEFKHVFDTEFSSSDSCSDCSSMESNIRDDNFLNQLDVTAERKDHTSLVQQSFEESTNSQETPDKQIDKTSNEFKNLELTSNEMGLKLDFEMKEKSFAEKDKEMEENAKTLGQEASDKTDGNMITEKSEETETILEDKVELRKQILDIDQCYNPDTSLSIENADRHSLQEPVAKASTDVDSEERLQTIALLELYQSQRAVAIYLEFAYLSFQDYPNTAREIKSTSQFAKNVQKSSKFGYQSYMKKLVDLISLLQTKAFSSEGYSYLLRDLHDAKVRTKMKESQKRFTELQSHVRRNIQQVEKSIWPTIESRKDIHHFKEQRGELSDVICPDNNSTQNDSDWKTGDEEIDIALQQLRPGSALTGGLTLKQLQSFDSYAFFKLVSYDNELDLLRAAYRMTLGKKLDTNVLLFVDRIVSQRKGVFDTLETIRKQEGNKCLKCLQEVERHLKNIDAQYTRLTGCWSKLIKYFKFLMGNESLLIYLQEELNEKKFSDLEELWIFVQQLFSAYETEKYIDANVSYRFIKSSWQKDLAAVQLLHEIDTESGHISTETDILSSFQSRIDDSSKYI